MTRQVDSKYVWIDGEVVPTDQASVSFFAHAVHYGTAVFEGIRCYDGTSGPAIFRLPEHLERLRRSAGEYFMEYAWTDAQLTAATTDLIRRHDMRECYIRPLVLMGEGKMGVRPVDCDVNVYLAVWSWGAYLGAGALENGISAKIVKQRKFSPRALDPTVKACGHYLNSVLATKEAAAGGYDEGILLNSDGRVAEGSGENIFIVKDGELKTNPAEESLLLGITRDSVMKIADHLGYKLTIGPIELEELLGADEAFFTGTAAEVTPIAKVDDEPIGSGGRGEITERVQTTYLDAVRGKADAAFHGWLCPV
ncbi:MAG: branched chain amino acid aminotransferase [Planctomycetes bacterium]|nr:branched chain amino acid aminotransferase [Planctomycetota bacterium]